jgi:hypothetical protein
MIDIDAKIVPGKGAAGFHLGQRIDDVKSSISEILEWIPASGKSLFETIGKTSGCLSVAVLHLSNGKRTGEVLYFANGMIELQFNSQGILFDISVFKGYGGMLWETIGIDSKLSLVEGWCGLVYDSGDEMHIPAEDSSVDGLAFYAEEQSLQDSPDQKIVGISVHDWKLNS